MIDKKPAYFQFLILALILQTSERQLWILGQKHAIMKDSKTCTNCGSETRGSTRLF